MDEVEVRERVALLFPPGAPRVPGTRVAVEHELLVADAATGGAVPVEAERNSRPSVSEPSTPLAGTVTATAQVSAGSAPVPPTGFPP